MLAIRRGLLQPTGTESAPVVPVSGAIDMGPPAASRHEADPADVRLPSRRLIVLGLCGMAEVIGLGILLDTGDLSASASVWAQWIGRAPQFLQMLLAALAAGTFLGWDSARLVFQRQASSIARHAPVARYLVHLLCFAAFAWVSAMLLAAESSTQRMVSVEVLLTTWLGAMIAVVVSFGASVWPLAVWKLLLMQCRWAIAAGCATGVAAWFVGDLANRGWEPLAGGTFSVVRVLLSAVYDDVLVDRAQLLVGTTRFPVVIAPACSGYEGIGLMGVFLGVFCFAFRERLRFPQVLLLLPLGFALVWLLNAVRIAVLIAIGTSWSSDIALGGFHSQAGWIVFNVVALGLVVVGTRLEFFARQPQFAAVPEPQAVNATASYLGPFLAVIAVGMLVVSLTTGSATFGLPALRIGAAVGALVLLRHGLHDLQWSFSWHSVACGVAVYGIWIAALSSSAVDAARPAVLDADLSSGLIAGLVAARLLGFVFVTPIVEELAFRGFLLRRVVTSDFQRAALRPLPWLGIAVSAVSFGAFHGANWLAGIVAGIAYGLAFARTGRLGDSIAAHATTNGLLAAHAMVTGNWAAWS